MKTLKKIAAIFTAAAMTVGAMTVSSLATGEEKESAYKLYVKVDEAAVGDVIPVSVNLDSNGELGVGGISFKLHFDPEELEVQIDSVKAGDSLAAWIGETNLKQVAEGVIGFAYTTINKGVSGEAINLLNFSVKVLKANSRLELKDANIDADDDDGNSLADQLTVVSETTVKCSHKNTETKTEITDCEKGGKTVTTCKDCGETVKTEDLAPAKHKVDKWTETKKATCTEEGEKEGVCTVCGKTVTERLAKSDHQFGEWKVTKPATCTEKGLEERVCKLCGTEKDTREIKMTEHVIDWKTEKESSCTEAGEKKGVCSICGSEFSEELPALGHDWGEWETVTEPTEDGEGLEQRTCGRCGEKEERPIAKLESSASPEPVITSSESSSATADPSATTVPSATTNPSATAAPDGNESGDKNLPTGAAIAIVPLAAALAAVIIISKKRK